MMCSFPTAAVSKETDITMDITHKYRYTFAHTRQTTHMKKNTDLNFMWDIEAFMVLAMPANDK